MKKIFMTLAALVVFTACSNNQAVDDNSSKQVDQVVAKESQKEESIDENNDRDEASNKKTKKEEKDTDKSEKKNKSEPLKADNQDTHREKEEQESLEKMEKLVEYFNKSEGVEYSNDKQTIKITSLEFNNNIGSDLNPYDLEINGEYINKSDKDRMLNENLIDIYLDPGLDWYGIVKSSDKVEPIKPGKSKNFSVDFEIKDIRKFQGALVFQFYPNDPDDYDFIDYETINLAMYVDDKGLITHADEEIYGHENFFIDTIYKNDADAQYYKSGNHLGNPSEGAVAYWESEMQASGLNERIMGSTFVAGIDEIYFGGIDSVFENEDPDNPDPHSIMFIMMTNRSDNTFNFNPTDIKLYDIDNKTEYNMVSDWLQEPITFEPGVGIMLELVFDGAVLKSNQGYIISIPEKTYPDGSIYQEKMYIHNSFKNGFLPQYNEISEQKANQLMK